MKIQDLLEDMTDNKIHQIIFDILDGYMYNVIQFDFDYNESSYDEFLQSDYYKEIFKTIDYRIGKVKPHKIKRKIKQLWMEYVRDDSEDGY